MTDKRYPIPLDAVINNAGVPMAGASVLIRIRNTGANATVYTDETGAATLLNPLTADIGGRVAGWVTPGFYEAIVSAAGYGPHTVPFDAGASTDSGIGFEASTVTAGGERLRGTPVGIMLPFAGVSAPEWWLLCDGAQVSRTTYADLFAVCGTRFGAGDGYTTFSLPDCRGRSLLGAGAGPGLTERASAETGGVEEQAISIAQMPLHSHAMGLPYGNNQPGGTFGMVSTGSSSNFGEQPVANMGNGQAHPNMHPWLAVTHIIRAV